MGLEEEEEDGIVGFGLVYKEYKNGGIGMEGKKGGWMEGESMSFETK